MARKNTYLAPEADLFEVGFEKNYLASFDEDENTETFVEDEEEDL